MEIEAARGGIGTANSNPVLVLAPEQPRLVDSGWVTYGRLQWVAEMGDGDGCWRWVVEVSGEGGWWRWVVEEGGGGGWWRRVVEVGGGGGRWRWVG